MYAWSRIVSCGLLLALSPTNVHADDSWRSVVEARTKTNVIGHMDSLVLYSRGTKTFVAEAETPARTEVRAYVLTGTERLHLEFEPYVRIFESPYRVSLGALEARASTTLIPRLRFGGYHHSSHNFSRDEYGWGISLNSLYVEVTPFEGNAAAVGGSDVRITAAAHVFLTRRGSAHVLTPQATVRPEDVGETTWMGETALLGSWSVTRYGADVTARGDGHGRLASVITGAHFMAKLWPSALGAFGDHMYAGPYVDLGWNLYETQVFGEAYWSLGLRLDAIIADPEY